MFINGSLDIEGETKGMYFVSNYAQESNERMRERFLEVVKATNEKKHEEMVKETAAIALVDEITAPLKNGE